MRHHRLVITGAVLGIAACAGGAAVALAGTAPSARHTAATGSAVAAHVTIVGDNALRFAPAVVRVRSRSVRVTFKDTGAYPHNIVVPARHFTSPSVSGDPGNESVAFTLHFPRRGRYNFYCQYHVAAGMVGTFIVS